jgi:hypothetical protein
VLRLVQRPARELDMLRTGERSVRVAGSTALPEAAEFTLDVSAASGDGGRDSTSRAAGISIPAGLRISNDRGEALIGVGGSPLEVSTASLLSLNFSSGGRGGARLRPCIAASHVSAR